MGPAIAVKAQETDEEKKVTSANTGSRIRFSWILAASMIAALWFWAAFFRALQHSIIPPLVIRARLAPAGDRRLRNIRSRSDHVCRHGGA